MPLSQAQQVAVVALDSQGLLHLFLTPLSTEWEAHSAGLARTGQQGRSGAALNASRGAASSQDQHGGVDNTGTGESAICCSSTGMTFGTDMCVLMLSGSQSYTVGLNWFKLRSGCCILKASKMVIDSTTKQSDFQTFDLQSCLGHIATKWSTALVSGMQAVFPIQGVLARHWTELLCIRESHKPSSYAPKLLPYMRPVNILVDSLDSTFQSPRYHLPAVY